MLQICQSKFGALYPISNSHNIQLTMDEHAKLIVDGFRPMHANPVLVIPKRAPNYPTVLPLNSANHVTTCIPTFLETSEGRLDQNVRAATVSSEKRAMKTLQMTPIALTNQVLCVKHDRNTVCKAYWYPRQFDDFDATFHFRVIVVGTEYAHRAMIHWLMEEEKQMGGDVPNIQVNAFYIHTSSGVSQPIRAARLKSLGEEDPIPLESVLFAPSLRNWYNRETADDQRWLQKHWTGKIAAYPNLTESDFHSRLTDQNIDDEALDLKYQARDWFCNYTIQRAIHKKLGEIDPGYMEHFDYIGTYFSTHEQYKQDTSRKEPSSHESAKPAYLRDAYPLPLVPLSSSAAATPMTSFAPSNSSFLTTQPNTTENDLAEMFSRFSQLNETDELWN